MFGLHVLMVTFKFPSSSWKTPFYLIVSNTFIFPFFFAFLIIFMRFFQKWSHEFVISLQKKKANVAWIKRHKKRDSNPTKND